MMVVDASVALRWFLNEPGAGDAKVVFEKGDAIAPDFALAEIANGLWSAQRSERIPLLTAATFVTLSQSLYNDLTPQMIIHKRAFEIACALDHPIYDCAYLALAEVRRAPFITLDMTFRAKTLSTPWKHLVSVLTP